MTLRMQHSLPWRFLSPLMCVEAFPEQLLLPVVNLDVSMFNSQLSTS